MNDGVTHPRNDEQHAHLLREVEALLDVEERLPHWPFHAAFGNVDICQYSHAVEGSFGPVLQALVDQHGDDTVTSVTLEPSAAYYHQNYGTFGSFRVSGPAISSAYWDAVSHEPQGDPTGALTYTANVVAIVGSTGRWSVWAERTWDLALVVSQYPDGPWRSRGVTFVPAETALAEFTEPDFKTPLTAERRAEFLRNVRAAGVSPA